MDLEQIFKTSIADNLDAVLRDLGYVISCEQKGLVEYRSRSNILLFVFEWNQGHGLYCTLRFDSDLIDFPLQTVVDRLTTTHNHESPWANHDISSIIPKWTAKLATELREFGISELTYESPVVQQLKLEAIDRTLDYNRNIDLEATKKRADYAWQANDYKHFIEVLKGKSNDFPESYTKKLVIARNRIDKTSDNS
ncbi:MULTISPECIES: hypothetical protein [unclassified Imperialibacter]|uniref:hypothetical protein n=1 Tax=unclassified Imperialibacter TaxID=2629706 RepID=UPI00125B86B9|nr:MULTISPECIES: hypothetical protein [unclassified Imperialibacter]CAD5279946.1 conserved hypothetical protein [Imperialibacter sp. 75]CAD5281247.1 conserved hypothetical protein [Imperialibacter sp. 89]VVT31960.1 conserved hypothetical protein [Imperialibacter sp. EC-SDR9]